MSRYSLEFKEQIVRRMMPPNAQRVSVISRETGIGTPTLYAWRNQFRNRGHVVPADPSNPEQWSGQDKLAVIVETAPLNQEELSEYCRRKGLYPEQVGRWRESATEAIDASGQDKSPLTAAEKKRVRQLEKELRRKDRALAEAAALLVLSKKAQAIWGDKEG